MNDETILIAKNECEEFLARVAELRSDMARASASEGKELGLYYFPRQTGALRRQSMEVTRALANLRRPG